MKLYSPGAHLGSTLAQADDQLPKELVLDWLKHPVTKVLGLVIVAELAHQLIIRHGLKMLGFAEEAVSETAGG